MIPEWKLTTAASCASGTSPVTAMTTRNRQHRQNPLEPTIQRCTGHRHTRSRKMSMSSRLGTCTSSARISATRPRLRCQANSAHEDDGTCGLRQQSGAGNLEVKQRERATGRPAKAEQSGATLFAVGRSSNIAKSNNGRGRKRATQVSLPASKGVHRGWFSSRLKVSSGHTLQNTSAQ